VSTPTILFLCTGNSCRSQMAEGWVRRLRSDILDPCSAGVAPKGLDPRAVAVMAEAGVDIAGQRSKSLDEVLAEKGGAVDWVVTVCDSARESCPVFPGEARTLHRSFDDPPHLAEGAASEEEALEHYRRVRDQIRELVESFPASLESVA
jgi:arsenate reductase (thioredoxin)